MKFPWSRDMQAAEAAPVTIERPANPVLLAVTVEPVMYAGEPHKWRLYMEFNTGRIFIGEAFDCERMMGLAQEIREELGI